jgi:hypothetical protein
LGNFWEETLSLLTGLFQVSLETKFAFVAFGRFAASTLLAGHSSFASDIDLGASMRLSNSVHLEGHFFSRSAPTDKLLIDN